MFFHQKRNAIVEPCFILGVASPTSPIKYQKPTMLMPKTGDTVMVVSGQPDGWNSLVFHPSQHNYALQVSVALSLASNNLEKCV
jgi:hypothetical protein